jgi:hypothetical protein
MARPRDDELTVAQPWALATKVGVRRQSLGDRRANEPGTTYDHNRRVVCKTAFRRVGESDQKGHAFVKDHVNMKYNEAVSRMPRSFPVSGSSLWSSVNFCNDTG